MDIQELIAEIGKGGWVLGRQMVSSACVEGEELVLASDGGDVSRLIMDGKNRSIQHGSPEVEEIIVKRPRMVKQQRKKIEGGGWHEVEKVGVHMTLTNASAKAKNEQWRKDEEKRRHEEAARQHAEAVSAFLSKQLALAGNGHVVAMTQNGVALVIEFENGHKLFIDSYGRGDGYYSSVLVEGGDTHTDDSDMEASGMELIHLK
ncbi:hypothetical protein HYV70_02400 [Candidatus Uhrbacteria bacterium]|nr:hypothetical protein [Candidatus Uhrbacteria bacterium]